MKTMINAAYGYMGATSMALFGDLGAANEVTRRGRALLDQIIEALRERGMVPIEADTDGVYFATPQEWSEAEERALVDEIGATLPAGIRLEYESRYAAMVSHAIKNYALLSYTWRTARARCGDALQSLRTLRRALLAAGVPLRHAGRYRGDRAVLPGNARGAAATTITRL